MLCMLGSVFQRTTQRAVGEIVAKVNCRAYQTEEWLLEHLESCSHIHSHTQKESCSHQPAEHESKSEVSSETRGTATQNGLEGSELIQTVQKTSKVTHQQMPGGHRLLQEPS